MSLESAMNLLARRARAASRVLYAAPHAQRKQALLRASALLPSREGALLAANRKDLQGARKAGLSSAMVDRLTLNSGRLQGMARGLKAVAAQPDPVGRVDSSYCRKDGLWVRKVRVPLGTILFIYESRPNITIDSAGLCVKSGNAIILRGGKEALHSNRALVLLFRSALKAAGLPQDAVQLVDTIDRAALDHLLVRSDLIDLVIPRGGEGLIRAVSEKSRIPVLKHYKGVCHVYVDRYADPAMAEKIAVNAKIQRPGVCNAAETLLLDRKLPRAVTLRLLNALKEKGVELLGCAATRKLLPGLTAAAADVYFQEHLALRMSVKVVDGVEGAAAHIAKYGSAHTDAIVTRNRARADLFLSAVDSASVMWNASTRLADGGEYGLGAEIGISTDKFHARGPMGAHDLTSYKWVVTGKGHLRK